MTQEISRNVQRAAEGTSQGTTDLADVQRGVAETGSASSQVLLAAQSLSTESNRLKREVGKFMVTRVRARKKPTATQPRPPCGEGLGWGFQATASVVAPPPRPLPQGGGAEYASFGQIRSFAAIRRPLLTAPTKTRRGW